MVHQRQSSHEVVLLGTHICLNSADLVMSMVLILLSRLVPLHLIASFTSSFTLKLTIIINFNVHCLLSVLLEHFTLIVGEFLGYQNLVFGQRSLLSGTTSFSIYVVRCSSSIIPSIFLVFLYSRCMMDTSFSLDTNGSCLSLILDAITSLDGSLSLIYE